MPLMSPYFYKIYKKYYTNGSEFVRKYNNKEIVQVSYIQTLIHIHFQKNYAIFKKEHSNTFSFQQKGNFQVYQGQIQKKGSQIAVGKSIYSKNLAHRYLWGTLPPQVPQFTRFARFLQGGVLYSIKSLSGPSQNYLKRKMVKLIQPPSVKQKFLMLDLHHVLIDPVSQSQLSDVSFKINGQKIKFNLRPHCHKFLSVMSQYYTIYIFTAQEYQYAEAIVAYLNEQKKTIHGILYRKNCMQTQNGLWIKDMRIIKNRELKDIVMVDNYPHSFGRQITNGIPIIEFNGNTQDDELVGIQSLLIEASTKEDVRTFLKQRLQLEKLID